MTNPGSAPSAGPALVPEGLTVPTTGSVADRWVALRRQIPAWQAAFMGLAGISACLALWWFVTRGVPEERIISPSTGLSSPAETFASFHGLWFDRAFTRNLVTTLRRLALGFGLATIVGVPLGVLCGCFPRVQAFFLPMTLFGRNIPVAALHPAHLLAFRHRRAAKSCLYLHRVRGLRHVGHDAGRAGGWQSVHRYGVHPGRGHVADDRQGALAPGAAECVQLVAVDLRARVRLHHAGRGGEVWR